MLTVDNECHVNSEVPNILPLYFKQALIIASNFQSVKNKFIEPGNRKNIFFLVKGYIIESFRLGFDDNSPGRLVITLSAG